VVGFCLQFSGLRSLRESRLTNNLLPGADFSMTDFIASILQLVAMIIMTAVRAWLRRLRWAEITATSSLQAPCPVHQNLTAAYYNDSPVQPRSSSMAPLHNARQQSQLITQLITQLKVGLFSLFFHGVSLLYITVDSGANGPFQDGVRALTKRAVQPDE
jgi:hypothetical protein